MPDTPFSDAKDELERLQEMADEFAAALAALKLQIDLADQRKAASKLPVPEIAPPAGEM